MHIAQFIQQYHPEYYSIETYPAEKVARICKVTEEWGDFSNFGRIPVTVDGVFFNTTERLYQVMKFTKPEARKAVFLAVQPKMQAKHQFAIGNQREDWPFMIVDAMKFCLMQKYLQSEKFRTELECSKGLFIVEDQTTFPKKKADTWGVKLSADGKNYVGPNLFGRLLMELRDNGTLEFSLPGDSMKFDDLRDIQALARKC